MSDYYYSRISLGVDSPLGAVIVAAHHDEEDDEHDEEAPGDPVHHGRGEGDGHRVVCHGPHLIIHGPALSAEGTSV